MIEITGDLFEQTADAIFITTNGYVKQPSGRAVMGMGVAKIAAERWQHLPAILGAALVNTGNIPHLLLGVKDLPYQFVGSFPVKPKVVFSTEDNIVPHQRKSFPYGTIAPGWAAVADLAIILQSAHMLVKLTDEHQFRKVCIPRPGCGAGQLEWDTVKPLLAPILDDRFAIVCNHA